MAGASDRISADRGVSEVVGVVLLLGMVIAGVAAVLVTSSALQEDVTDQQRMESAQVSMTELDSGMGSIVNRNNGNRRQSFSVTERDAEAVSIVDDDSMTITINGNGNCRTSVPLDGIRYNLSDAGRLTYQAGAVWKTTESGTTMVSPPDVGYRDGTLDLSLTDMRGRVDDDFTARKDVAASRSATQKRRENLFGEHDCRRPDSIRITVESQRYHAVWADYLRTEMPENSVDHDPADGKVTVRLDQGDLPEASDDARNRVVEFSASDVRVRNGRITVDKSDANEYHASVTVLGAQGGYTDKRQFTVQKTVSHSKTVPKSREIAKVVPKSVLEKKTKTVERERPVDVVFVLDESGSMENRPCDWNEICDTRLGKVVSATDGFLSELQSAKTEHRAGLVGFGGSEGTTYSGLTTDISSVRTAASGLSAGGQTPMADGMAEANAILKGRSSEFSDHEKVMILLTDGHHDGRNPMKEAREAAGNGVTIYTVGVGDGHDSDLLGDIAGATGGKYYSVDNSAKLGKLFDEISDDVTEETVWKKTEKVEVKQVGDGKKKVVWKTTSTEPKVERSINRTPVTMSMNVGGTSRSLSGGGPPTEAALNLGSGGVRPTGMTVTDGNPVSFSPRVYGCAEWKQGDDTVQKQKKQGKKVDYKEATCEKSSGKLKTSSAVDVYTDGDSLSGMKRGWWQKPLSEVVPDRYLGDTDNDPAREFDLHSNEAVVVVTSTASGPGSKNSVVVLFEAGRSDEEFTTEWTLNLQVNVVDNENT